MSVDQRIAEYGQAAGRWAIAAHLLEKFEAAKDIEFVQEAVPNLKEREAKARVRLDAAHTALVVCIDDVRDA